MKKSVIILAACICLGTTGCGTNNTTEKAVTPTTEAAVAQTDTTEEESSSIQMDKGDTAEYVTSIDMVDYSREIKDENGVLMLKVTQNSPDVTIDGSAAAADNINDFYLQEKDTFDALAEKYAKDAKEYYAGLSEKEQSDFHSYELGLKYSLKRADDQSISIVKDGYEYTGGAHPNAFRQAATFDTASGEQLTLDKIFDDVDQAKSFITDYLTEELKNEKYKDALFDDYEKDIPSILDDNTWYLSDEGFVVISNEYIISPHSTGILEFTIPYNELKSFSDLYRPSVKK